LPFPSKNTFFSFFFFLKRFLFYLGYSSPGQFTKFISSSNEACIYGIGGGEFIA